MEPGHTDSPGQILLLREADGRVMLAGRERCPHRTSLPHLQSPCNQAPSPCHGLTLQTPGLISSVVLSPGQSPPFWVGAVAPVFLFSWLRSSQLEVSLQSALLWPSGAEALEPPLSWLVPAAGNISTQVF